MRAILCNKCARIFRSKGISRVMRKVVFHFCAKCWADRERCETFMDSVSSTTAEVL